jgi:hypothetical protein
MIKRSTSSPKEPVSINVASVKGSLWKTSYTTFTTLPRDATTAIYEKN